MKKLMVFLILFFVFLFLPSKILASGPPDYNHSSHSGPSGSISADGTTTGTITIHLEDSSANNVTSDSISLSSSNDGTAVFNNNQTTDSNGNATFTITSKNVGTTNVTLTDNTNAATFVDWFTVTFYSATLGCSNVPAAPVLTSVTSNSNYTATLTWTDSANPVSNYLVSYGTTSGKYIYGDSNIGAQGTTTFTVGSLSGNKKYYFVVAASNNCGASSFSNEMSVTVGPTPAPVPTIVAVATPISTPINLTVGTSVAANPTDTPVEDTPVPETAVSGGNTFIRDIAIILLVLGVGIIILIIVVRKNMMEKKSEIPQIPLAPPVSQIPPVPPMNSTPPIPPTGQ